MITALITPLRDGNVDEAAFAKLLERQIAAGVHGVVPMGTTGEGASMDLDEHKHVIELCVRLTAGRVAVIAGTGSPYTKEAIDLTRHAKTVGADGALIVSDWVAMGTPTPGRILRVDPATGAAEPVAAPAMRGPADLARSGDRLLVPVMLEHRVAVLPAP